MILLHSWYEWMQDHRAFLCLLSLKSLELENGKGEGTSGVVEK